MNSTEQQNAVIPRLTFGSSESSDSLEPSHSLEHISISHDNTALCGASTCGDESRIVADDSDPLSEASVHLCPDCADEWFELHEEVEREPTVQCQCMRREDSAFFECGTVTPATEARPMQHADREGLIPVCHDCYDWLDENTQSDIVGFEQAQSWAEMVENGKRESTPNSK
jgi:hypothetical protein